MFGVLRLMREVVNQQGAQLGDFDEKSGAIPVCKEDAKLRPAYLSGKTTVGRANIPGFDKRPPPHSHEWECGEVPGWI